MRLRYLSLCSGIEAASVAWKPLGWTPVAFAEIEPFPCAVLNHHYPDVPNLGDITRINGRKLHGAVDLVVAGTPCQDFSIAGRRAGMAGERSGLAREFARLVREINPQWIVWENVPGAFSTNGGRDFGSFIKALDDCGYCCAWRVLDAQFFGVPQRRRRIFIVGYFGDWRPAAEILFESESVRRNPPQGRKTGKDIAACLKGGSGERGWENGAECTFIAQLKSHWDGGPHPCLHQSSKCVGGIGMSDQELFSQKGAGLVPASAEQRSGQAVCFAQNQIGELRISNLCGTLNQNGNATGRNAPLLMAMGNHGYVPDIVAQAISCKWAKGSSGPAGDEHHNLIAIQPNKVAGTLYASGAGMERASGQPCESDMCVLDKTKANPKIQVRRLTPRECERLQGFPDDYTAIEYREKPAADSPRYKALGNSMAVPVMRWIGERIDTFCNKAGMQQ